MRPVYAIIAMCLLGLVSITEAKSRRQRREEARLDSIRVADSIRIADSIRVADSLTLARYASADQKRKEKQQREAQRREQLARLREQAARERYRSEGDAVAGREIVLTPGSDEERMADSIQAAIESMHDSLFDDPLFGKTRDYDLPDKLRYCGYVLENDKAGREEVAAYVEGLHALLSMEYDKLRIIMDAQEGNNRAFLLLHVKRLKDDLRDVSAYLSRLSGYEAPEIVHDRAGAH